MAKEDGIKKAIGEMKKENGPSNRKYLAIFLIFVLIGVIYAMITQWDTIKNALQPKTNQPVVGNREDAVRTTSDLGKSLQNASSVLEDIGRTLG